MPLSKRQIDALAFDPAGKKTQTFFAADESVPGFGVRLYPSGAKSFVVWCRTSTGRKRLVTLGRYGVLTVQQAREKARETLVSAAGGADPIEVRRAARNGDTLADFAKVYLDRHAKPNQKSWRDTKRRIDKYILPALGARKLEEIRRSDVANVHAKVGQRAPYVANRVLATLSHMFNAAIDWGFMEETAVNPASRVKKYRERSRDRWVKPEELPRLVEAIDAEASPYTRAYFKLALLTGCRRAELCGLRWPDIDLSRRELRLDDTKAGRSHTVPLSAPAVAILSDLPREPGSDWVFPGPKEGEPLKPNGATQQWIRIRTRFWLLSNPDRAAEFRERAEADVRRRSKHAAKGTEAVETRMIALASEELKGSDHLRLHDLRRTVGSWLAEGGASLPLIGRVLNHTNASTTQIYARLGDDPARAALEAHGRKIIPIEEKRGAA